eukprot:TRINITY_DN84674_c0_g1_i1.p1 TRINITY_DN84674_c0_g1~~TRINITY_DN84674_c0_g1_i1.p1  ORF type:complete len:147 (+),score=24.91 TRINITY_DN84674_c0_g1_i1:54-494(+)
MDACRLSKMVAGVMLLFGMLFALIAIQTTPLSLVSSNPLRRLSWEHGAGEFSKDDADAGDVDDIDYLENDFDDALGAKNLDDDQKKKVFSSLDKNGDDFLDASELKAHFDEINKKNIPMDSVTDTIALADQNGDGKINFAESLVMY